jgi:uridylate kinase
MSETYSSADAEIMQPKYKRVVLKLSGEALRESGSTDNISFEILRQIAGQIKEVHALGTELAIVIGGGNFWRGLGAAGRGMDRTTADYIGMLATVMNALALSTELNDLGVPARVLSAIEMKNIADTFTRREAVRNLTLGRVVIFAAGVGSPFFSTDTTAALRANEIGADVVFKATKVDGVYDADPKTNPDAKRYEILHYREALNKQLRIMDSTAFSLCMDNKLPLLVFDMVKPHNIKNAVLGRSVGTLLTADDDLIAQHQANTGSNSET